MVRVNFVKAAAKDYPAAGIKKGEPYYWWQPYRQYKRMSKTRPKPSQVATNEYAQQVLELVEELEEWQGEWSEADRDELVGRLEEIRDDQQDKYDNLPEGFQQGNTGVMIEDRIAALEEWMDELRGLTFPEPKEEGEEGEEEGEESPLALALAAVPSV